MANSVIHVLLVDDDEDDYFIVGALLQAARADGFDLSWAPTYQQGLEAILASRCDVCLVDYRLGAKTGLDLIAEVRAQRNHPEIILLTGEGDHFTDITATKAGAADYLEKDGLTPALLERSIRYAAERGRALQAARDAGELAESMRLANLALQQMAAIQRTNQALVDSNMELRRFAYVASHDLQSPLRSISGFLQLLQSEYVGRLDERADDWIRRTLQSVTVLQTLILDLLSYSRVDSQGHPFECVPFRAVLDSTLLLLDASIRDSGTEVTCGELPTVMGDRTQLIDLMLNLIGNAVKYRGNAAPNIHVSAERSVDEWTFTVRDNGIGIDVKHRERVFEVFQRLHHGQTYSGTGMGLAICRRVVNRHGGRIWVEAAPGGGSLFNFTLSDKQIIET